MSYIERDRYGLFCHRMYRGFHEEGREMSARRSCRSSCISQDSSWRKCSHLFLPLLFVLSYPSGTHAADLSLVSLPRVDAAMSSVYFDDYATTCIDDLFYEMCHSSTEPSPYLMIDMGSDQEVHVIEFYSRSGYYGALRAKNIEVYVSSIPITTDENDDGDYYLPGNVCSPRSTTAYHDIGPHNISCSSPQIGRYVIIHFGHEYVDGYAGSSSDKPLNLKEVYVYGRGFTPVPIALADATASSASNTYPIANCIDGDEATMCRTEVTGNTHWLAIDLNQTHPVRLVRIINRRDKFEWHLTGVRITVQDSPVTQHSDINGAICLDHFADTDPGHKMLEMAGQIDIYCPATLQGRYLIIEQYRSNHAMSLMEVSVFSDSYTDSNVADPTMMYSLADPGSTTCTSPSVPVRTSTQCADALRSFQGTTYWSDYISNFAISGRNGVSRERFKLGQTPTGCIWNMTEDFITWHTFGHYLSFSIDANDRVVCMTFPSPPLSPPPLLPPPPTPPPPTPPPPTPPPPTPLHRRPLLQHPLHRRPLHPLPLHPIPRHRHPLHRRPPPPTPPPPRPLLRRPLHRRPLYLLHLCLLPRPHPRPLLLRVPFPPLHRPPCRKLS